MLPAKDITLHFYHQYVLLRGKRWLKQNIQEWQQSYAFKRDYSTKLVTPNDAYTPASLPVQSSDLEAHNGLFCSEEW